MLCMGRPMGAIPTVDGVRFRCLSSGFVSCTRIDGRRGITSNSACRSGVSRRRAKRLAKTGLQDTPNTSARKARGRHRLVQVVTEASTAAYLAATVSHKVTGGAVEFRVRFVR